MQNGNFDVCKILIQNVTNKQPRDKLGRTPLHYAAQECHLDICSLILENVNEKHPKDDLGSTPKDVAVERKNEEIVKLF